MPYIPGVIAPLPQGTPLTTRQQKINYYANILAKVPGTYQGNYKQYDGYTWSDLYLAVAAQNSGADPLKLADAVLGLYGAQKLGVGLQAAGNGLGQFITQTENAAANTNFAAGAPYVKDIPNIPNPLSGLAAIGDFFSRLTQANTWMRVLEIGVGVILVAVALNKLLGNPAGKAVDVAAKAVP